MKKKKRIKLHEVSLEEDIKYRGPLSYRHFRIIGWICIAISQVCVLLGLATKLSPDLELSLGLLPTILSYIASLSIPLLLLASFSVILGSGNGYKRQLMTMGGAAAAIIVLFELFMFRYIVGTIGHVLGSRETAKELVDSVTSGGSSPFLSFNLFVDVVMCILFAYFLIYQPAKGLSGKKLWIFRSCALIPVFYEIASFILKAMAVYGHIKIPTALFPFLTTKPPMMFLVFVVLAFYIKNRERRFCKNGRTHKEYQAFLKTNRNSWNFSVFTAKVLAIAGALDFILLIIYTVVLAAGDLEPVQAAEYQGIIDYYLAQAMELGLGKSVMLAPFAPVVLLFSYTRTYKNTFIDLLIPIGGVVLIIFVYLEGIYYGSSFISFGA